MDHIIRPHAYIALRLPSDTTKIVRAVPNTTISIGKYGTFQTNHILGRPYYLVFEILDRPNDTTQSSLRIVSASETYAELNDEASYAADVDVEGRKRIGDDGVEYEVLNPEGKIVMRTNRDIIDDTGRQKLSMEEIETLKRENTGSGKELIAKILESHSALDQKTAFGLAKYTLRKAKKYLRRFTVLPLDVTLLANWILDEKEPMKIMEIREEILAIIGSWSNVHCGGFSPAVRSEPSNSTDFGGKWLVVDETGGLLIAAMAERMGILYPPLADEDGQESGAKAKGNCVTSHAEELSSAISRSIEMQTMLMSADTDTITLIHSNAQPNLSLLTYFDFDTTSPILSHPLYTHLKTLSWLQLLSPEDDSAYIEPEIIPDETLQTLKSGKKGNYYRKRRRWERVQSVVDQTRAGGFDGLVVASAMNAVTILHHAVPLLRGAAQVVVYSPNIEPLAELADCYSTARRTAFLTESPKKTDLPNEDFPLNPTLLLAPTIQTVRCRGWQVLPGRTHPLMTGRGGAEGYVFTATRVLPVEGKVEARGSYKRRRLGEVTVSTPSSQQSVHGNAGNEAKIPSSSS